MTLHAKSSGPPTVIALMVGSALLFAVTVVHGQSENVITFGPEGPSVGDAFVYLWKDGNRTLRYEEPGVYRYSNGAVLLQDQDGNTLKNRDITIAPHSGIRPPGNKGQLQVGQIWSHNYTEKGKKTINRKRKCEVVSQEDLVVKAGLFKEAFKIKCKNRRLDRSLPRYEEIWFAPHLDLMIKFYKNK